MRVILLFAAAVLVGCSQLQRPSTEVADTPRHVRAEGSDGTIVQGELLNGSVAVECGQGILTLVTDHIQAIDFGPDAGTVHSPAVKVSGWIKTDQFLIKNEHGVFTLQRDKLRRISFLKHPATAPANGLGSVDGLAARLQR